MSIEAGAVAGSVIAGAMNLLVSWSFSTIRSLINSSNDNESILDSL